MHNFPQIVNIFTRKSRYTAGSRYSGTPPLNGGGNGLMESPDRGIGTDGRRHGLVGTVKAFSSCCVRQDGRRCLWFIGTVKVSSPRCAGRRAMSLSTVRKRPDGALRAVGGDHPTSHLSGIGVRRGASLHRGRGTGEGEQEYEDRDGKRREGFLPYDF